MRFLLRLGSRSFCRGRMEGHKDEALQKDILNFWFGLSDLALKEADEKWRTAHGSQVSGDKMRKWYNGGQLFDDEIREKYGKLVEKMSDENDHDYDHWQETPLGVVAAVIVLDQFTRNIYRKTPKAFAADPKALRIALHAIEQGIHKRIQHPVPVCFLLHPFEHSEDIEMQKKGLQFWELLAEGTAAGDVHEGFVASCIQYHKNHQDIIARFSRFPHRNVILGRESTPEELAFLVTHSGF